MPKLNLEIQEIIVLYESGYSTTQIGELAGVSSRYIRQLLTENGVEKRPIGSWKRKYTFNEDYFKNWNNDMAYLLGFFIADGYIASQSQSVAFTQKNPDLLEEIKSVFGSNQPLYRNKHTGVYSLLFHSKVMKNDLQTLFHITSDKSYNIKFPNIPNQYMHHFIRGYFDGDGHINYKGYTVSFVGGSITFMESLQALLLKYGFNPYMTDNGKHSRVFITGRKSIKQFGDWIYTDKSLYLKRKFAAFDQEKLSVNELQDRKRNRS